MSTVDSPVGPVSPGPNPWLPTPYRVERRDAETDDTVTLTLRPPDGVTPSPFAPGQFNMLYRFGVGEAAVSICGDSARPDELRHTVRVAGKVTESIARSARGETVGVRGPYGVGWPMDGLVGRDVVIVAGGLGLPPLRPALLELLARRGRYGRLEMIYGARTPKDLVFYDEVQRWRRRDDLRIQVTVDAAGRDWYGDVGLVTARLPDARFDPARTSALLCGPEIMMRLTARSLRQSGVPDDQIFVSMERNMKCAIGLCGHCQYGQDFVCRSGPVFSYAALRDRLDRREV